MKDKRPVPIERKNVLLWQAYLHWWELVEMRKRHNLRISSARRGKSNYDAQYEQDVMDAMQLDYLVDTARKTMVNYGQAIPVWDWVTSIKGLAAGPLATQLLAQIDDIGKFDNVRSLWRFAGYGLWEYWVNEKGVVQCPKEGWQWVSNGKEMERVWTVTIPEPWEPFEKFHANGESARVVFREPGEGWELKLLADKNVRGGWHSPFNRKLKGVCFNVAESFIKQQTQGYVDLYYSEKARLRGIYPEPVKVDGKKKYTDGHIDFMARRRMVKEFLKHLWLAWREAEELPITEPYQEII